MRQPTIRVSRTQTFGEVTTMTFLRFSSARDTKCPSLARVRCEALLECRGSHHSPLSPRDVYDGSIVSEDAAGSREETVMSRWNFGELTKHRPSNALQPASCRQGHQSNDCYAAFPRMADFRLRMSVSGHMQKGGLGRCSSPRQSGDPPQSSPSFDLGTGQG
jgi:hypothetical protein